SGEQDEEGLKAPSLMGLEFLVGDELEVEFLLLNDSLLHSELSSAFDLEFLLPEEELLPLLLVELLDGLEELMVKTNREISDMFISWQLIKLLSHKSCRSIL